jgi:hypothetical protein
MEDLATSAYLRLARIMNSSKVYAMARIAKLDEKLGYNSVPLCITFEMPSRIQPVILG